MVSQKAPDARRATNKKQRNFFAKPLRVTEHGERFTAGAK